MNPLKKVRQQGRSTGGEAERMNEYVSTTPEEKRSWEAFSAGSIRFRPGVPFGEELVSCLEV